ncbi:ferredoxin, partial [Candidatus Aerophobetes bacterium]
MAENKKKNLQVSFLPSGKKVTFQKAISLREAIIKAKIDFSFPCGGNGLCGKCKVKVKGNTNPPSLKEKETIP